MSVYSEEIEILQQLTGAHWLGGKHSDRQTPLLSGILAVKILDRWKVLHEDMVRLKNGSHEVLGSADDAARIILRVKHGMGTIIRDIKEVCDVAYVDAMTEGMLYYDRAGRTLAEIREEVKRGIAERREEEERSSGFSLEAETTRDIIRSTAEEVIREAGPQKLDDIESDRIFLTDFINKAGGDHLALLRPDHPLQQRISECNMPIVQRINTANIFLHEIRSRLIDAMPTLDELSAASERLRGEVRKTNMMAVASSIASAVQVQIASPVNLNGTRLERGEEKGRYKIVLQKSQIESSKQFEYRAGYMLGEIDSTPGIKAIGKIKFKGDKAEIRVSVSDKSIIEIFEQKISADRQRGGK